MSRVTCQLGRYWHEAHAYELGPVCYFRTYRNHTETFHGNIAVILAARLLSALSHRYLAVVCELPVPYPRVRNVVYIARCVRAISQRRIVVVVGRSDGLQIVLDNPWWH